MLLKLIKQEKRKIIIRLKKDVKRKERKNNKFIYPTNSATLKDTNAKFQKVFLHFHQFPHSISIIRILLKSVFKNQSKALMLIVVVQPTIWRTKQELEEACIEGPYDQHV